MKKRLFNVARYFSIFLAVMAIGLTSASAATFFGIDAKKVDEVKADYDDDSPYFLELGYDKVMPPDVYNSMTYDIDKMKQTWVEAVGLRAPDVVGKIAPEIKPGIYKHQDKEKHPGLKKLMIPAMYEMVAEPGPPFAGNFPEVKVVPTRQYYYALPIGIETKKNIDRAKQDDLGYMIYESVPAGLPFPKPSGKFKAQQIIFNHEKRYINSDAHHIWVRNLGFDKNLNTDFESRLEMNVMRVEGRAVIPPLGWFDKRAEKQKEARVLTIKWNSPRDLYGNAYSNTTYLDRDRPNLDIMYINALRRLRKLSGTDTQDTVGGQDITYDDGDGLNQKLSPTRYPYEYKVIGDREFLIPAFTMDGSGYLSSEGKGFINHEWERRPMWVVEMNQLDDNYVYSKRIIYIDKELFNVVWSESYDKKDRLYRTQYLRNFFEPKMGMLFFSSSVYRDYRDLHSTVQKTYVIPYPEMKRADVDLRALARGK